MNHITTSCDHLNANVPRHWNTRSGQGKDILRKYITVDDTESTEPHSSSTSAVSGSSLKTHALSSLLFQPQVPTRRHDGPVLPGSISPNKLPPLSCFSYCVSHNQEKRNASYKPSLGGALTISWWLEEKSLECCLFIPKSRCHSGGGREAAGTLAPRGHQNNQL